MPGVRCDESGNVHGEVLAVVGNRACPAECLLLRVAPDEESGAVFGAVAGKVHRGRAFLDTAFGILNHDHTCCQVLPFNPD